MDKKITILTISDMPIAPSGVGTQTRYMIESLLKTGKYRFICLGGAIKHSSYDPVKTEEYGDDWIMYPTDGYGNAEMVRSILRTARPDMVWFMTDPRFFQWLWDIENEIRAVVPMVYYHVWDNTPYPMFNKLSYESNDAIVSISKVTNDIVRNVAPNVELHHIPHAVDPKVFKKLPPEEVEKFKNENNLFEKTVFFWNNRNARRKQSGSLIFWFKDFLDRVGHDKAVLIMHTDPSDPHGQDLTSIISMLGLINGEVRFSKDKIDPDGLAMFYNVADCTINVSDAEGFGLSTLESLSCETPIIVNMTGGLQEQITDGEEWFGIGLEPASKSIIGSQDVPYIYEDRLNGEEVADAMTQEEKEELGKKGRNHVVKNYSFEDYCSKWNEVITDIHERHGSWDTRSGYNRWTFKEVV